MKACPACAEQIPPAADTCPHCGVSIPGVTTTAGSSRGGNGANWPVIIIIVAVVTAIVAVGGVLLLCCGGLTLPGLMLPAVQQAREAARRTQCNNNLKQIGLALHMYHDEYNAFPPAYIADASGKPMHSWRVLILPYLDQQALYNDYSFSEPWDGPNNSRLLSRMPPFYACPSHPGAPGSTTTAYAAVFGEHCVFRGSEPVKIMDITDGTSNTLIVVEAAKAGIPWMKPEDIDITLHPTLGDPGGFSSDHTGGVQGVMADGSVHFLSQNISQQVLDALFTRDGKEAAGPF
jgi:hypothetical protein